MREREKAEVWRKKCVRANRVENAHFTRDFIRFVRGTMTTFLYEKLDVDDRRSRSRRTIVRMNIRALSLIAVLLALIAQRAECWIDSDMRAMIAVQLSVHLCKDAMTVDKRSEFTSQQKYSEFSS